MADTFAPDKRSWVMSRIRSGNTSPEKVVRSYLHSYGHRFRLHRKDLPGKPDIILPRFKTVIFVHGCFWHQCPLCKGGRMPKSKLEYWEPKLKKNKERDARNAEALERLGWKVIVVWACQLNEENLRNLVASKFSQATE